MSITGASGAAALPSAGAPTTQTYAQQPPTAATSFALSPAAQARLYGAGLNDAQVALAAAAVSDTLAAQQTTGYDPTDAQQQDGSQTTAPLGAQTQVPAGSTITTTTQTPVMDPSQMSTTYPQLSERHVIILTDLGITPAQISILNNSNPTGIDVENYIQSVLANPSALDTAMGLPAGTTASRIAQIPQSVLIDAAAVQQQTQNSTANPPVDSVSTQYPGLASSAVAVLQAAGAPASVLQGLSDSRPAPSDVQQLVQLVEQDPEDFDQQVGNPTGTARQGLIAAGYLSANAPAPGKTPSGAAGAPLTGNSSELNNVIRDGVVLGGGGLGVYFLTKKMKARKAAQVATEAVSGGGGADSSGVEDLANALRSMSGGSSPAVVSSGSSEIPLFFTKTSVGLDAAGLQLGLTPHELVDKLTSTAASSGGADVEKIAAKLAEFMHK